MHSDWFISLHKQDCMGKRMIVIKTFLFAVQALGLVLWLDCDSFTKRWAVRIPARGKPSQTLCCITNASGGCYNLMQNHLTMRLHRWGSGLTLRARERCKEQGWIVAVWTLMQVASFAFESPSIQYSWWWEQIHVNTLLQRQSELFDEGFGTRYFIWVLFQFSFHRLSNWKDLPVVAAIFTTRSHGIFSILLLKGLSQIEALTDCWMLHFTSVALPD